MTHLASLLMIPQKQNGREHEENGIINKHIGYVRVGTDEH